MNTVSVKLLKLTGIVIEAHLHEILCTGIKQQALWGIFGTLFNSESLSHSSLVISSSLVCMSILVVVE